MAGWRRLSERELGRVIARAASLPELKRLGPKPASGWSATVQLVGGPAMTRLNRSYRGKNRPTDVLSFHPPAIFRDAGLLGELVICLPVLKRQAREIGHAPETELRILLTHGVLHLLGLDHERSAREAVRMAGFEAKLLMALRAGRSKGLIGRAGSGTQSREYGQPK